MSNLMRNFKDSITCSEYFALYADYPMPSMEDYYCLLNEIEDKLRFHPDDVREFLEGDMAYDIFEVIAENVLNLSPAQKHFFKGYFFPEIEEIKEQCDEVHDRLQAICGPYDDYANDVWRDVANHSFRSLKYSAKEIAVSALQAKEPASIEMEFRFS